MSIDGIGRPPIPKGDVGSVNGPGPSATGGDGFRLTPAAAPVAQAPSELLSRLESGDLSVDGYVQARIDEAVRPLEGRISAEQLQIVRDSLAEQLQSDPVVIELVRRATAGAAASGETAR